MNSRFTTASNLTIVTFVLIPNFPIQSGNSKNLQPIPKRPHQIFEQHTDVTDKLNDHNKKEIVQHRNNLLPLYPKNYALGELSQLFSFTGLHIVYKITDTNDQPETTHFNQLQQPNDISQKSVKNIQNQQLKNKESIVSYKKIQIYET